MRRKRLPLALVYVSSMTTSSLMLLRFRITTLSPTQPWASNLCLGPSLHLRFACAGHAQNARATHASAARSFAFRWGAKVSHSSTCLLAKNALASNGPRSESMATQHAHPRLPARACVLQTCACHKLQN